MIQEARADGRRPHHDAGVPMIDPNDDPQFRLLRRFGLAQEIGDGLNERQYDLAHRSRAFRALMRSAFELPDLDSLHSLTLLWERVGSPEGKSPRDYLVDQRYSLGDDSQGFEDKGAEGVFASWESSGWYAPLAAKWWALNAYPFTIKGAHQTRHRQGYSFGGDP